MRPDFGAKLFGHRAGPFAAGRASHKKHHPAHAPLCGRPDQGRSFSDTEPAPFAAGRASHRKQHPAHAPLSQEPRPRGEASPTSSWHHSPRGRASHRKQHPAHAPLCGRPDPGRSFSDTELAPSPRGAPPAGNSTQRTTRFVGGPTRGEASPTSSWHLRREGAPPRESSTQRTTRYRRSPDLGAKLLQHRVGAIRRGARLPQEAPPSARPALWEARPRGEAFRTPSQHPSPRGRASHTNTSQRTTRFVGGPTRGEAFKAPSRHPSPRERASRRKAALLQEMSTQLSLPIPYSRSLLATVVCDTPRRLPSRRLLGWR